MLDLGNLNLLEVLIMHLRFCIAVTVVLFEHGLTKQTGSVWLCLRTRPVRVAFHL
jgi:hypothetical protein